MNLIVCSKIVNAMSLHFVCKKTITLVYIPQNHLRKLNEANNNLAMNVRFGRFDLFRFPVAIQVKQAQKDSFCIEVR